MACQGLGPHGHSASHPMVRPCPRLPGTLKLTVTRLVTAPSRRSGGTRSSRAAVWISAQLDTAATSWDSRWTEEGGSRERSAWAAATSHRAEAGPCFAQQLPRYPKVDRWVWAAGARSRVQGPRV